MREVEIIAVGKLKEPYLREAENSFRQEISKKIPCRILTVQDEKTKDGAGLKEMDRVKEKEGFKIEHFLDPKAMVIVMDLKGKELNTKAFSDLILETLELDQKIQIIIGGSWGISDGVLQRAKKKITFSKMTYPHQLFRIMVLEELSRALL